MVNNIIDDCNAMYLIVNWTLDGLLGYVICCGDISACLRQRTNEWTLQLQFALLPAIGSKQGSKLRIVLTVLYAEIGN